MLFLKGTRDALADNSLMQSLVKRVGSRATLKCFQDADHSFHISARGGHFEVRAEMLDAMAGWIERVIEMRRTRRA
jgi:hypothetical protein